MVFDHLQFGELLEVWAAFKVELDVESFEWFEHGGEPIYSKYFIEDNGNKLGDKLSFDEPELKMKWIEQGSLQSIVGNFIPDGVGIIMWGYVEMNLIVLFMGGLFEMRGEGLELVDGLTDLWGL